MAGPGPRPILYNSLRSLPRLRFAMSAKSWKKFLGSPLTKSWIRYCVPISDRLWDCHAEAKTEYRTTWVGIDTFSDGHRISQSRGRQPQRWGQQPLFWPIFPKKCMKMKKIRPRGRCAPLASSLGCPNDFGRWGMGERGLLKTTFMMVAIKGCRIALMFHGPPPSF